MTGFVAAATVAAKSGHAERSAPPAKHDSGCHATRFVTPSGTTYIRQPSRAPSIVDQYAWLIGTFGCGRAFGIVLVVVGGIVLARSHRSP